jgi:hypothetical protein
MGGWEIAFWRAPSSDSKAPNPSYNPDYKGTKKNGEKFMGNWHFMIVWGVSEKEGDQIHKQACKIVKQAYKQAKKEWRNK